MIDKDTQQLIDIGTAIKTAKIFRNGGWVDYAYPWRIFNMAFILLELVDNNNTLLKELDKYHKKKNNHKELK